MTNETKTLGNIDEKRFMRAKKKSDSPYINQAAFSKSCGVSRQRIHQAIQEGLVIKTSRGIDPDNPSNRYYRERALSKAAQRNATKPGEVVIPVIVDTPPEEPKSHLPDAPSAPGTSAMLDLNQKTYEETRLKKIKADLAVLEYAEKVNAIIDNESLQRKMGVFTDFLFNKLVYLPEEISDMLWARANASDDPERELRIILSDKIAEVIKAAKGAAEKIKPPKEGIKYIMEGLEDNEIFGDQA